MKILMVTMAMHIGGAETHILELCRTLHEWGHDVTLASNGGVYAEELVAAGVRHVQLPLHTKSPKAVLTAYRGLKTLIERENFDLVHAHARIPGFLCGLLWNNIRLSGGRKFRFVTTAHLNFSVNPLWRRISRWGERTMAVSEDIADYLVAEYGIPRERIHLTINGIDCAKFAPSIDATPVLRAHGLDASRRRIVYLSRLDADRAEPAYRILDIAERLYAHDPETDILLVGGGTELDAIRRRAAQINARLGRDYIHVPGAVSNTNEYCAAADVFIGVSRSLLEAMAAAKPVIIAGNQGALGIFDESKIQAGVDTNFCCRGYAPATADDLYRDITALLDSDPAVLTEMGAYNRAFVEEHYTARRMAQDYLALYEALFRSPTPFHRNADADVVISGYYGFGNLGDESLLDIIAATLAAKRPDLKIAAFTRRPRADQLRTGLTCISRINLPVMERALRRTKLLISGGGSLLQDTTSRRSLSYYATVLGYAERCGTKTAVFANGIGPISYDKNRALTRRVIEAADHVSVRDADSFAELVRLGVTRAITVRADPAYLIEPSGAARLGKVRAAVGIVAPYFVVSIRQFPVGSHAAAELKRRNDAILRESIAFCRAIAAEHGLMPVILPMQASHDRAICEALAAGVPGAVVYTPESAPDLIGVLGGAAFVIGMRLHAVIFASSAGVPVIGLSYDPKVSSMMASLGQPYAVDLTDDTAIASAVRTATADILRARDAIATDLAARATEMRRLCMTDVDEVLRLL